MSIGECDHAEDAYDTVITYPLVSIVPEVSLSNNSTFDLNIR
jgi:hypothetical protein